ncbi:MAG: hypothetical protein Q7T86_01575 [Hyphomicrobiaceae bacterium]|nr:hypothetical protein [Hyphomicrobiaceae bacterium]
MRNRYRRPRFAIALLTALAGTASFAHAEDVVVMPYRCAIVEGKPVLTPADETGHRILGKLEKQKVKTCSTVDPKRCRQWATFKFDVDCSGTRVPWMQVFANAGEHTRRRVWERNGRLRVQNTTQRSKRIDDMCARRMGVNQEWWSVNEICDEASPLNAPTATEMPAGFAPMVGLDAVFLPEGSIAMPSQRTAKAGSATATQTETASIETAPQAKPASAAAAETATSQKVKPALASEAASVAPGDAAPVALPSEAPTEKVTETMREAEQALPPQPAREEPMQTASQSQPAIARAPAAATENATAPPAEPAAQDDGAMRVAALEVRGEPGAVVDGHTPAAPDAAAPERAAGPQMAVTATETEGGSAGNAFAYIIVALASGFLLTTLLVVKWLGRADTSETVPQDVSARDKVPRENRPAAMAGSVAVASTVDPGELPRPSSGTALAVATHHFTAPAPTRRQVPQYAARSMTIGERMPSTTGEALAVLGMGVASESNLGSLKKIIDGLRMNWHPDHAQDEADRQDRELRLKQINAAWDILGGKAAGASR